MTKELVGYVGVDSGAIFIGDPCYTMGDDASHRVKDWSADMCHKIPRTDPKGWPFGEMLDTSEPLGEGVGVNVFTPYGDGSYPVYAEKDKDGTITRIVIEFMSDEDDDEDE